jgi:hypothetical protein
VLRVIGFFIMLPLLTDSDKSLYFLLLVVVSGLIRVPLAMWLFGDKIQKPIEYFFGLGLAGIATIICQYKPGNSLSTSFNMLLFFVGVVKMVLEVTISLLLRKITSPDFAQERCVSVKATQKIFAYFDVVFGLIGGLIVAQVSTQYNSSLPNYQEMMGILWIGIVVTLFSTIAGRLLNELSHATAQPISTLRPLLGLFMLFTSSNNTLHPDEMLSRTAAVVLVVVGANISFWLGKPFK